MKITHSLMTLSILCLSALSLGYSPSLFSYSYIDHQYPSYSGAGDDSSDDDNNNSSYTDQDDYQQSVSYRRAGRSHRVSHANLRNVDFSARVPQHIDTDEKVVVVNPNVHAWGAYDESGTLVRAGLATSGSNYCPDLHRRCHTKSGTFRVYSLGSPNCKSHIFPIPRGGAPMPYCMFFNGGQALHGSYEMADANLSHGCVRLHVEDAEWLRYNFINVGTKVIVKPY